MYSALRAATTQREKMGPRIREDKEWGLWKDFNSQSKKPGVTRLLFCLNLWIVEGSN